MQIPVGIPLIGICRMRLSASAAQHGMLSFFMEHLHQRGRECRQQEQSLVSGLDAVHLVSRHDADNAGVVGNNCSCKRTASIACEGIVDLHLPGMGVVTDGTAGIDPYMVQAYVPAALFSGHQVPEKDTGKFRVGIPRQGFNSGSLSRYNNGIVPAV
jgi:hypothetical protein